MGKAIECGCRAVIVNSEAGNDGVEVTVGVYIGKITGWAGNRWMVDKSLTVSNPDYDGETCLHAHEGSLQRIDYDGNKKLSWESLEHIWTPDKVGA